jgi:hypothetical protein
MAWRRGNPQRAPRGPSAAREQDPSDSPDALTAKPVKTPADAPDRVAGLAGMRWSMIFPLMDPRLPLLRSALDAQREALASAYEATPPELRDARSAEDRWSVAEVLEHLAQTERGVARLLTELIARAAPRPADEPFSERVFLHHVEMPEFLDRTRRFRGTQPTGEMSATDAWTELGRTRLDLIEAVERGAGLRLEDHAYPHPFVGDLDLYQWIAFVGLHEVRHAEQIRGMGRYASS